MICYEKRENGVQKEPTLQLSLLQMFQLICPPLKKEKLNKLLQFEKSVHVLKAFYANVKQIVKIQQEMKFCFVVYRKKKSKLYLVFDGSQTNKLSYNKQCKYIIISQNGQKAKIIKHQQNQSLLSKIVYPNVWQENTIIELLINYFDNTKINYLVFKMPSNNYNATKNILIALNLWNKITIYFCVCFLPRKKHIEWINSVNCSPILVLEAYTGSLNKLKFAPYTVTCLNVKKTKTTLLPRIIQQTTTETTTNDLNL